MSESKRLWVCHQCELIGSGPEAARHADATDHPIEELDQATSDAIRAEQEKQRPPHPTAADYMAFADFKRKVQAGFE